MMPVSRRDCRRMDNSRRQLCKALTRINSHNADGADVLGWADTGKL